MVRKRQIFLVDGVSTPPPPCKHSWQLSDPAGLGAVYTCPILRTNRHTIVAFDMRHSTSYADTREREGERGRERGRERREGARGREKEDSLGMLGKAKRRNKERRNGEI
jgi:hypothetical protein